MADFALDLRDATSELAATAWPELRFRTVIHTGPVVAGIIGRAKFAYDIWGDTVNTAWRLEEVCELGEILITETVRPGLPDRFTTGAAKQVLLRDKGDFSVLRLTGRKTHSFRCKD